jgi:hypothetical protein
MSRITKFGILPIFRGLEGKRGARSDAPRLRGGWASSSSRWEAVSDELGELEFEIKPAAGGHFRAVLHSYRPRTLWDPPEVRLCVSEREAMRWINARLALRGFAEPFKEAAGDQGRSQSSRAPPW